jgi:hypothetical protein
MAIATISPVTGEILKSFDELTPEQLDDKLARAGPTWRPYTASPDVSRPADRFLSAD